jgi:hypothetical protein
MRRLWAGSARRFQWGLPAPWPASRSVVHPSAHVNHSSARQGVKGRMPHSLTTSGAAHSTIRCTSPVSWSFERVFLLPNPTMVTTSQWPAYSSKIRLPPVKAGHAEELEGTGLTTLARSASSHDFVSQRGPKRVGEREALGVLPRLTSSGSVCAVGCRIWSPSCVPPTMLSHHAPRRRATVRTSTRHSRAGRRIWCEEEVGGGDSQGKHGNHINPNYACLNPQR